MSYKAISSVRNKLECQQLEAMSTTEINELINKIHADNKALHKELEDVREQVQAFRDQLVCEASQYQEIFNYTNDGQLAVIALDHKKIILELLNSEL